MNTAALQSSETASAGPLRTKLLNAVRTSSLPAAIAAMRHKHHVALCASDPLVKHLMIDGNETFDLVAWNDVPVTSLFTIHAQPRGSDFIFQKTSDTECQRLCAYDDFDRYRIEQTSSLISAPFPFADLRRPDNRVAVLPDIRREEEVSPSVTNEAPEQVEFRPMSLRDVPDNAFFVLGDQTPFAHSALYLRDASGVLRVGSYGDHLNRFRGLPHKPSAAPYFDDKLDTMVTVLVDREPS